MIPLHTRIQLGDVLNAVRRIDREGIPPRHHLRSYKVMVSDRAYPAKLLLSYAYGFAHPDLGDLPTEGDSFTSHMAVSFFLGMGLVVER